MRRTLSTALIIFMGLSGVAFGQSGKDAYKALKKIEARVETGVSYKDYSGVISDARAEVNMFLDGKEAKKNPQLAEHMKKAMDYYMTAGKVLVVEFTMTDGSYIDLPQAPDNKNIREIKKLYPKTRPGGVVVSDVLRQIWGDASKELKIASQYLKTD